MAGHWYSVSPRRLKPSHRPDDWVFGHFHEFATQREDGKDYRAYLFRSADRTVYGGEVWSDRDRPKMSPRDWATKVVLDPEFRESLRTNDRALIALWKNR